MSDLFNIVSSKDFERIEAKQRRAKLDPAKLDRTLTNWLQLSTRMAFCEVPNHESIQQQLDPTAQSYRQAYPTRWCIEIDGMQVCRDCWMAGEPT